MANIQTPGGKVQDGDKVRLTLAHGPSEKFAEGKVRSFEQDGERHWELMTNSAQWPAIGFVPENVTKIEKVR